MACGTKSSLCAAFITILLKNVAAQELTGDQAQKVSLNVSSNGGINVAFSLDNVKSLVGTIGVGKNFSETLCANISSCQIGDISLGITVIQGGFNITWESKNTTIEFKDCFDLKIGKLNWYGGPERKVQKWPLEQMTISGSDAYILRTTDNLAVVERYWLNSKGAYIFVDERVPLFVDQNEEENGKVCFISKVAGPYVNRQRNILTYSVILKGDPKQAHLHAVSNYLGKPTGHPNEKMIKEPIWTTWAKYKSIINDSRVLSFAQDIRKHGFKGGQLEIDDAWEKCYGAQEFSNITFNSITETVKTLKEMNFRVTLWIHPFVDSDCQPNSDEGYTKGYFVKDAEGNVNGSWWNSNNTRQIDFTNPDAAEWFAARLRKLQANPGIDNFKFDAGESNYGPQPSVYDEKLVDIELVPNILSEDYLRTCAQFGSLLEVRSAWRTQDLPMFVRMIDKDSNWGEENGLYTLITTLLQMNMNGYTMVLPDMVGGNGYNGSLPSAELIVRWTQANTFMPSMQFSYLPWDISSSNFDSVTIVKKFVDIHALYSDKIISSMNDSINNGSPVNAPIWWIDPTDALALASDDEFLLGDDILVAPVIKEGAVSRDIYLPRGNWTDCNNGTIYKGPITLHNYSAPIDVLPYFAYNDKCISTGYANHITPHLITRIIISVATLCIMFFVK